MTVLTIEECLKHGTAEIGRRDAMLLLCHLQGCTTAHAMLNENEPVPQYKKFLQYVQRYKSGEPMQYIIGHWDFMGHTLKVDGRALIPRPETELLVEGALKFLQTKIGEITVLDLCTGSGCIAAAIAGAGEYSVTAVDISTDALSLAQENGGGLGIEFVQSDLFANVREVFDLIISNPPYITDKEMAELSPTVLDYEPHLALHGGMDGMDIYRMLIPESLKFLKPGGALFLEIGPPQVKDSMQQAGFADVQLKNDYAGLPRIVYGVKQYV